MDSDKKYTSITIPSRADENSKNADHMAEKPQQTNELNYDGFAEIEIDYGSPNITAAAKILRSISSATKPETITQRPPDPIRERFYEMRKLATDRPFARDDSELFYKQAKFMENFEDNYENEAKFFMYYPYYQHMGYEQLRTYFTWRTRARRGNIRTTSPSYVYIYIYELLNNIGVESPSEGLEKLMEIYANCLSFAPDLESKIPIWLKDYHVLYEMPHSFSDFVREHKLYKHYSASFLLTGKSEDNLDIWNSLSSYDVYKSRFINDGNETLYKDCFHAVLDGLRELCEKNNSGFEDLFIYTISKRMPWRPFRHALYHKSGQQVDREVELPGPERYYCKNNSWTTNLPMYYSTQRSFIGYIMKKTEACLRESVKYKYKFKTEPEIRYNEYFAEVKGLEGRLESLDATIKKSVAQFHWDMNRTVVTVDTGNLERIRLEALGTQEKLIVPDNAIDPSSATINNALPEYDDEYEDYLISSVDDETIENTIDSQTSVFASQDNKEASRLDPATSGFDEETSQFDPVTSRLDPVTSQEDEFDSYDDSWKNLKEALNDIELSALAIALKGGTDIRAFCDQNGIMLEVLADSINEKAADFIGDSILDMDAGFTIYDEYKANITPLIK